MKKSPYIVGISGGSASGKTSFLKELRSAFPDDMLCIVSQDNYYKPKEQQEKDENGEINFDLPESINRQAFHNDLVRLIQGQEVRIKEYTFNNAGKQSSEIILNPAPIIIMEGLFIFYYEEIRALLDLKVYIDARDELKLQRRLKRDYDERGYGHESVLYQWNNHVMPSYHTYLRPFRDDADLIVTNNLSFQKGLEVLSHHLQTFISE
ncbi:MAG: uridine kinase [Bacteroidia bacterium]